MIVLTDLLRKPFDEGAKNTAFNIIKCLSRDGGSKIISLNGDESSIGNSEEIKVGKSLIDWSLLGGLARLPQNSILYIPESSATLFSLLRAKLLRVFTGKYVCMFALQPRNYSYIVLLFIKFLAPNKILTPSLSFSNYLIGLGVDSSCIPLGVDNIKYHPFTKSGRVACRQKFNIDPHKKVLLHVGHIRKSRNLELLMGVRRLRSDVEVVVVGSTYNQSDEALYKELLSAGVIVINEYIENMAEIYNLADYYVFTVKDDQGAIATPLSVLEAMACNIKIMTTKFGSLVDMFEVDDDFNFVENSSDVVALIKGDVSVDFKCTNREKIENHTWENIAKKINTIVGG